MNLNMYYELCDDWGWFIDIENNNCNENISLQPRRFHIKKFNSHLNKLPTIEEDDLDYYQRIYQDTEEKIYKNIENNYNLNLKSSNKNSEKNSENTIFNVGSITLITAVLTYFILIVI
jgi:hypothetical protein